MNSPLISDWIACRKINPGKAYLTMGTRLIMQFFWGWKCNLVYIKWKLNVTVFNMDAGRGAQSFAITNFQSFLGIQDWFSWSFHFGTKAVYMFAFLDILSSRVNQDSNYTLSIQVKGTFEFALLHKHIVSYRSARLICHFYFRYSTSLATSTCQVFNGYQTTVDRHGVEYLPWEIWCTLNSFICSFRQRRSAQKGREG